MVLLKVLAVIPLCVPWPVILGLFPDKDQVPGPGDQLLARSRIKEVFKKEYEEGTPTSKLALAEKFIQLGLATTDDSIRRYVLFREARDLAVQAGESEAAFRAVDLLVKNYSVDELGLREEVLSAVSRDTRTPESAKRVTIDMLSVVDAALAADRYDIATRLASSASKIAPRAKDSSILSMTRHAEEHSGILQREFSKLEASRKSIGEDPNDPTANLAIGSFYCFLKEDWKHGLVHLAKSDHQFLRPLSVADLSYPKTATAQADLAGQWLAFTEKQTGTPKKAMERRAVLWYETALPHLVGLERAEVDRKISTLLFGTVQVWETSVGSSGVALGGENQNIAKDFTIEFWFSTTSDRGVLLTKRHQESDASITLLLQHGQPAVMGDASFYKVEATASVQVNDGKWHHLAAVKTNARLQLYVDGKALAEVATRPNFPSKSPWVIGFHRCWKQGAIDAKFCKIRISKIARYSAQFSPRGDYVSDKDALLLK